MLITNTVPRSISHSNDNNGTPSKLMLRFGNLSVAGPEFHYKGRSKCECGTQSGDFEFQKKPSESLTVGYACVLTIKRKNW